VFFEAQGRNMQEIKAMEKKKADDDGLSAA
jgi:hypothetical protein